MSDLEFPAPVPISGRLAVAQFQSLNGVGEAGGGDAEEARGLDIEGEDRSWDGK